MYYENTVIDTKFGRLAIHDNGEAVTQIDFVDESVPRKKPDSLLSNSVVEQIERYMTNPHIFFDLPINVHGTTHQEKVWAELLKIPPAEVRTYGQLAEVIGSSPRAVGNACRRNPISLVVPCHRVVAAGHLGGYGGHTDGPVLDRKRRLLQHEGYL